jgi:hypothetical protein
LVWTLAPNGDGSPPDVSVLGPDSSVARLSWVGKGDECDVGGPVGKSLLLNSPMALLGFPLSVIDRRAQSAILPAHEEAPW